MGFIFRWALRHRTIVTVSLVAVLLLNLLVVTRVARADPLKSDLPVAGRCQGGGPGCDSQPLIPPPVGGLPHFDAPPAPAFGVLVLVRPQDPAPVREAPPPRLDRPPITSSHA
jgi:hypothetical protein